MSLTKSEFEEWWHHPVTKIYMATLREGALASQEEALAVAHHRSVEEVALNAVAYSNRANTLIDMADMDLVRSLVGVQDED